MEDKVVLITGAASGIGAATAKHFVNLGYKKLALVDVDAEKLSQVAKECQIEGAKVQELPTDLSDHNATGEIVPQVIQEFERLDVLINNAGVASYNQAMFGKEPLESAKRIMDINFFAGYLLAQKALPHLEKVKGNIVWTSSMLADIAGPTQAAYSATKGATECLSRGIALEYGPKGIRSNTVKPGGVPTSMMAKVAKLDDPSVLRETYNGMHAVGRCGEPLEVARVIAFLASEDSGWITGGSYKVDGGATLGKVPDASKN